MRTSRRMSFGRWGIVIVVVMGLVTAAVVYDRLFRGRPAPYFETDQDHFLFGSIGSESTEGISYWIWLVLPRVFPDLLPAPGGYTSLGMLFVQGRDLPIGLSRVTVGYPRVGLNCAFCHTAAVRRQPSELPTIVSGAPAHQTSVERYRDFLVAAAADPRFTAGTILGEIARNYRLSAIDRLLYRFVVIPGTRQRLLRLREQRAWMDDRPDLGHGRADVFSPIKFHRLGRPLDSAIGSADMMPLWNAARREADGFFWDGLHASLRDAVITSALSAGTSRPWLDADVARWDRTDPDDMSSLRRISRYVSGLTPPAYPFSIDQELAAQGAPIYEAECGSCHAPGGGRATEVQSAGGTSTAASGGTPGTDPDRLKVWTAAAAAAYKTFSANRVWRSSGFQAAGHYVPVPLDGLWLRAPYLHNGSVPSLRDLLEPPPSRPVRFWRGFDVYDPVGVGFVSDGADARRLGTLHDTTLPGNANTGHAFGTDLPAESKRALLEYLKTL